MNYNIGDKIVYPVHGAGVIESIEDREIMGEMKEYYIMRMPIGDMKVMIPVANAKEIGIRDVIDKSEADKVIAKFKECSTEMDSNWNKRSRENAVKIKSGNIYEVAQVVKSLMFRDKTRGLSTGERKMLNNAKQIMISELVMAKAAKQSEIENIINEIVNSEIV